MKRTAPSQSSGTTDIRLAVPLEYPQPGSLWYENFIRGETEIERIENSPGFEAEQKEMARRWRERERQEEIERKEEDRVLAETEAAYIRGEIG